MTKAEKIKQLNKLGYKFEIENGTIIVYTKNYEDPSDIKKLFSDYESSYGIRPDRKSEDPEDFEKYMNKPEEE